MANFEKALARLASRNARRDITLAAIAAVIAAAIEVTLACVIPS